MFELKHCGTQILETKRLILRPFEITDAEDMFRNWANSENVTRYLTWLPHKSVDVSRAIISEWLEEYKKESVYHWGLELKETGEAIGDIAVVKMDEAVACAELGWCIGEKWWGKGMMPEAAMAVRDFLFDQVGFNRVQARHDTRNPKSGRVMQKIGMRYEGIMRQCALGNLGICDLAYYAILKSDRD